MSDLAAAIRTALRADPALTALAVGGVYTEAVAGPLWIARDNTNTAAAFDVNGELQPCLFIHVRGEQPAGGLIDPAPARSVRRVVELHAYHATDQSALETMARAAWRRLDQRLVGGAHLSWLGHGIGPVYDDRILGGAYILRSDYAAFYVKE